jgi:hypothetical protein
MLVMIVLQVLLPPSLTPIGRWTLPAIEAVLLVVLLIASVAKGGEGRALRGLSLTLILVASVANGLAVALLVDDLVREHLHPAAGELLGTGANIWLTNVIIFGVWFWELDRGGPMARANGADPHPDFLFPQMSSRDVAPHDWEPRILDYLYVSFTNATAFSPTDAMPLTRGAKAGMMLEEAISLVTAVLVIARAVNVLG